MPPKRMTANPVRPARYRPGKPVAPEEGSSSGSESESEASESAPSERPQHKPVLAAPAISAAELKSVDLNARFRDSQKAEAARLAAEAAAAEAAKAQEGADGGDRSSDDYTTDTDDEESEEEESEEERPRRKLLRPTFVSKAKRQAHGITAVEDPESVRRKAEEEEKRKAAETHHLLEEHLKREAAARAAKKTAGGGDEDEGGIDDTDGVDPAAERAAWKLRELKRIKRERDALEAIEKEREEIERRREMDPALREKEDMEFVAQQKKEKMENRGKMGFMQKFYHKGAFYQDESEILKRDYATAEVEDRAKNREVLPKYMQVRGDEVGKRGRTRWTHLSAEDTTLQPLGDPRTELKGVRKDRANPNMIAVNHADDRFRPDPHPPIRKLDGFENDRRPREGSDRGVPQKRSHSLSRTQGEVQQKRSRWDEEPPRR